MHCGTSRSGALRLVLVLATMLATTLAACSAEPTSGIASPDASARASASPVATEAPTTPEPTRDPNLPPQAETGWGTIWTLLPPSFPEHPGATTADPAAGPVSGAFTVPAGAADAKSVAEFYLAGLDALGYGTGIDGPLEDGSYAVWASNAFGCDAQVTVLPRGDESLVTVLYGAGCPFV